MEYIKFNNAMSWDDLLHRVKRLMGAMDIQAVHAASRSIIGVSNARNVVADTVCFIEKAPGDAFEALTRAVVITNPETATVFNGSPKIIVEDPRALFIDLLNDFIAEDAFSVFSSLRDVSPSIHPEAEIHPAAIIEEGVHVGRHTRIAAGCVIKRGTHIGEQVIVRENTVIGTDGIALYRAKDGRVMRFPHIAGVIIEQGVELGASCVISKGVMNATTIGRDCVIGNLSNLGHGVRVGAKVWMSVGCMIGGNSTIGDYSTLGLGVCLRDNLRVGNACSLGMGSVVVNDVDEGLSVLGNPARRLPNVNAGPQR